MKLNDLVQKLKSFNQILVVGPHRSGTTIAATILADELKYQCIYEESMGESLQRLELILSENYNDGIKATYQAPLLTAYCHLLPDYVAVVFMDRSFEDVDRSEARMGRSKEKEGWETWKRMEMSKYFGTYGKYVYNEVGVSDYNNMRVKQLADEIKKSDPAWMEWYRRNPSVIKPMVWHKYQKDKIKAAFELEYESLSQSKLWVPKENRKNFNSRQISE